MGAWLGRILWIMFLAAGILLWLAAVWVVLVVIPWAETAAPVPSLDPGLGDDVRNSNKPAT
jgi:hypothetical protein